MYKNWKLRSKLLVSFIIMAIVAAAIGIVGILGIRTLQQEDTEMYVENTLPMGDLATMYDTLASQRICAANMVLFRETDPDFSADETEALSEKEKLFEDALAVYKTTITTSEEQSLYDNMVKYYDGEFKSIKADLRAAVAADDEQAMHTAMKSIDDMGSQISGYMDDAFALNVEAASNKVAANDDVANQMFRFMLIAIGVGLIFAVVFALFLAKMIATPVSRIMSVTKQVGETGSLQFSEEIIGQLGKDAESKDEIGQTAAAFCKMMDAFIEKTGVLEQVANGDLTVEVDKASASDTLGNAVEVMVENLNGMFGEINLSTDQVSSGSTQIASGAQTLAQATTEQSATVQQLLSSISEVAGQTAENAVRAEQASSLAENIKSNAELGAEQMSRMTEAVQDINDASQSISAIIKVIDDIAFQTNILALNAAVEAARAGEHGKGFAVVAEEVRSLAGKSAEAAKNTSSLIQDTVEKAELGAKIAVETSHSLDTIVEGINESSVLVGSIAASSEQQSMAVGEINKGIDQVSQVIQQNSATAEQSAAAAQEMSNQAAALKSMVERFKLRDSGSDTLSAPAAYDSLMPPSDMYYR